MKLELTPLLLLAATASCASTTSGEAAERTKAGAAIVLASEVEWQALNPARGDASPRAATLWGDRNGSRPTGFLVRFKDGFSSPPHIHNVTYRGVVISGLVHNDDPDAEETWMPTGSFWTQPRGAAHITAAQGETIAYIEIDEGPYLVHPVAEAFATEERAVNVPASQIEWTRAGTATQAKLAPLWGDPEGEAPRGLLVRLPSGTTSALRTQRPPLLGVVIQGRTKLPAVDGALAELDPGSHFRTATAGPLELQCSTGSDCLLYVRQSGDLDLAPISRQQ